jgi:probable F420-dependent oxidoreductase
VKLDVTFRGTALADVPGWARRAEELGVDGVFTTETNHDPFFPLVLAAEHTQRVELGTGIALAFPRSPMHLAYQGWDLHALSQGRFVLGLGSQVRAHVVRRFGAEWSQPARRMRELVLAVRAIWQAWQEDAPLQFEGEFYRHTLMPPAFRPERAHHSPPRIFLAAVQERMTEVAGEVADGLMVHPLQTARYLRDTQLPALERGLLRSGRRREDVEVSLALFVVTDEAEEKSVRERVAFYGSTPAYRQVLDAHGFGEVADRLHELSRAGEWASMSTLVTDEVLDAVAVRGRSGEDVAAKARERYAGLVDRINLHAGEHSDLERWAPVIRALNP